MGLQFLSPVKQVPDVSHAKKNISLMTISTSLLRKTIVANIEHKHCAHVCARSHELEFVVSQLNRRFSDCLCFIVEYVKVKNLVCSVHCSVDIYLLSPNNLCHYGGGGGGVTSRKLSCQMQACKGVLNVAIISWMEEEGDVGNKDLHYILESL